MTVRLKVKNIYLFVGQKKIPNDLRDFLKLLARPKTAEFLAEKGGILIPFVFRLLVIAPGLLLALVVQRVAGLFNRGVTS